MTTKEKNALDKYLKANRATKEELAERSPIQLIDTIASAIEALDYSNYDCNNLRRIMTHLLNYWEEHNTPLGDHIPETFEQYLKRYL